MARPATLPRTAFRSKARATEEEKGKGVKDRKGKGGKTGKGKDKGKEKGNDPWQQKGDPWQATNGKGKGKDADGKGKAAVPGGDWLEDSERIRVLQRYDVLRDKVGRDGKTACMRFIAGGTCVKGNECVYSHDRANHSFGQADLALVKQALGVIDRRYTNRRARSQSQGAPAQWQPGGKGDAKNRERSESQFDRPCRDEKSASDRCLRVNCKFKHQHPDLAKNQCGAQ